MNSNLKKLFPILGLLPFLVGTAGHLMAGEMLSDAMYASLAHYFVSVASNSYNPVIDIARWTAPCFTVAGVLFALQYGLKQLGTWLSCSGRDSVAVHADRPVTIATEKGSGARMVFVGRDCARRAKSHIIMLDSDTDSLDFYYENYKALKDRRVYLCLRELEQGLLKAEPNVICFDINTAIARSLWKQIALWKQPARPLTVSIYGGGNLGQCILHTGLLLNLMDPEQQITYRLITDSPLYALRHRDLETFNGDRILFTPQDDPDLWQLLADSDLVILAREAEPELLQALVVRCRNSRFYFYDPKGCRLEQLLDMGTVRAYGQDDVILTDANIRSQESLAAAIALNRSYAESYGGEADWNRLSGFLKGSNIASADFQAVLADLSAQGRSEEALAELEHIRWCRYHSLNYWTYGEPEGGKDPAARLHHSLKSYAQLSEAEREKDRDVVRAACAPSPASR